MGHTHRCQLAFKKKKNQVMSPSPESRVPETGSDPPIGSDRDSGRDKNSMPPSQVSKPPAEKKVDLDEAIAQMLTSHTTFMNETKATMHNQSTHPNNQAT